MFVRNAPSVQNRASTWIVAVAPISLALANPGKNDSFAQLCTDVAVQSHIAVAMIPFHTVIS